MVEPHTASRHDWHGILLIVNTRQVSNVGIDVVRKRLVADAGHAIAHRLEDSGGWDVQR